MVAPNVGALLSDGSVRPLKSFYQDRPLALIFLRHLGCVFCREHVAELKGNQDWNMAFVCPSTPEEARLWVPRLGITQPMICDERLELYEAFDLHEGNVGQFISPRVIARGFQAMKHGFHRPVGNPKVLGGSFVIATDGRVTFEHHAHDAADNAPASSIAQALDEAAGVARKD